MTVGEWPQRLQNAVKSGWYISCSLAGDGDVAVTGFLLATGYAIAAHGVAKSETTLYMSAADVKSVASEKSLAASYHSG
jgi:hypothetical protein